MIEALFFPYLILVKSALATGQLRPFMVEQREIAVRFRSLERWALVAWRLEATISDGWAISSLRSCLTVLPRCEKRRLPT